MIEKKCTVSGNHICLPDLELYGHFAGAQRSVIQ